MEIDSIEVRKDLDVLCTYAKKATQYREINRIVDNLKHNILVYIDELEDMGYEELDTLLEEANGPTKATFEFDTYDEEGNQD
jgi:DNA transposition AAA+ family ATPase